MKNWTSFEKEMRFPTGKYEKRNTQLGDAVKGIPTGKKTRKVNNWVMLCKESQLGRKQEKYPTG